jgi:hypothetical protein
MFLYINSEEADAFIVSGYLRNVKETLPFFLFTYIKNRKKREVHYELNMSRYNLVPMEREWFM